MNASARLPDTDVRRDHSRGQPLDGRAGPGASTSVAPFAALGLRFLLLGRLQDALRVLETALAFQPQDKVLQRYLNRVHRKLIPRWHFAMLNDSRRIKAFRGALEHVASGSDLVLDIGAGTALLAVMAVRAGARAAVSCEMVETVAELAVRIVEANGLGDRISVVPKASFDLVVGRDLPHHADVLVTETIDCGLLGEGLLPIIRHARAALLRPGASIIPRGARVYCRLLESRPIHENNYAVGVGDFDACLFNYFSSLEYFPVRLLTWEHRFLSLPAEVFRFDFLRDPLDGDAVALSLGVEEDGLVHGVVFWFEVELGGGWRLTNAPGHLTHWMQAVQCFGTPVPVQRGQVISLRASHETTGIFFELLEH